MRTQSYQHHSQWVTNSHYVLRGAQSGYTVSTYMQQTAFFAAASGGVGAALVGRRGIARAASGKISVYSALNESTNNAFVEAFKKSVPGINVELLPLAAAGELQTRIRTEKTHPREMSLSAAPVNSTARLAQRDLLPYKSPNAATWSQSTRMQMACGRAGTSASLALS